MDEGEQSVSKKHRKKKKSPSKPVEKPGWNERFWVDSMINNDNRSHPFYKVRISSMTSRSISIALQDKTRWIDRNPIADHCHRAPSRSGSDTHPQSLKLQVPTSPKSLSPQDNLTQQQWQCTDSQPSIILMIATQQGILVNPWTSCSLINHRSNSQLPITRTTTLLWCRNLLKARRKFKLRILEDKSATTRSSKQ